METIYVLMKAEPGSLEKVVSALKGMKDVTDTTREDGAEVAAPDATAPKLSRVRPKPIVGFKGGPADEIVKSASELSAPVP